MTLFRASLLLALVPLAGVAHADDTTAPARVDQATAARQADRLLAELVTHNSVPGMGAAVWQDGRIVWRGSAGFRDLAARRPVDADTVFRLASVSKLITVAAAAQLADAGKLDLDAPVATLWDGVNPEWAPFTLRQLAAHTAGLPHYQAQDADRGRIAYPRATDAVAIFRERPLLSAPGRAYSYSSWGYTLISAVVEARSGQSFLDYVARHVTPGLRIGPDATHGGDADASKAYALDGDGRAVEAPRHDYSYTWGGGGFGATASALAEFGGRMQRGQVVSAERFADMLVPARLDDGSEVRSDDYTVGFGWRTLTDLEGRLRAQHAGVTLGARSSLVTWPQLPSAEQTAATLLSNMEWVSSIDQSAAMLAAPFQAAPAGLVSGPCPTAATRFRGTLRDDDATGAAHFTEEDGSCIGTLQPEGALKAYFDQFPQPDRDTLRLVGLYPGHGLARAALVTPIGLYDLRATADGQFVARLGASSELRFTLDGATPHAP
ncbi:serine hydrolase domain-containing protein [Arenimonas terrae]|uniref:Class A beta-lactamase-related serine hydrolase n=1 Tax=Arenimonas terrae TaxID=2546226 RepID=A0A5C4RVV4_9GAMM|nr:serine hydrolase domain-containing protein [Arenimonas terrae]TNJ34807.1 class A beta-lactamase-related serine hydrolase [Arenimonas terrae]